MAPSRRGLTAERLQGFCGTWPGVGRDIKWGDVVFSVDGKMFLIVGNEGRDRPRLAFKAAEGRFLELTDREGIVPAPYLARAHWVSVTDPARFATDELETLVRESYEAVRARLTRRRQIELGVPAEAFPKKRSTR